MPNPSPLLRLALAGAGFTVGSSAAAANTQASVFAGLRLSVSNGHGFGLGTVLRPALLTMPDASTAGAVVGLPVVWTHTFGQHKGNALDVMGQVGGAMTGAPCPGGGLSWYLPLAALTAQGGARWTDGEQHWVFGGNLAGAAMFELDYTADLADGPHHRTALGIGFPVPVRACSMVIEGRPLRCASGDMQTARVEVMGSGDISAAAAQWLRRAGDELAAVRSFVELSNHLRAHAAPTALVDRAAKAAEEELEHAAMCMGIAARLLGRPVRGTVPPATRRPLPTRAALAAEAHLDGWHNEGQAAHAAAIRAETTGDRVQQLVESRIAQEEMAHAQFGRDVDQWACWMGGRVLRRQRAEVLDQLQA